MVSLGWACAALAGLACAVGLGTGDRGGAVLAGVAAVVLAALSLHGTLVRPRLAADATGVRVRSLSGTDGLDWPSVRTRLRTTRRLGRDTDTLELESGDRLYVLGRLELGADPRDVLDILIALRAKD